MKILENKVTVKTEPAKEKSTREIECNECGSVLEITESDKHIGWLGARYVTCPCCGNETMIEDEDGIILSVDNIKFPTHFYRTNKNLRQVKEVSNEEIENVIKCGIEYFREHKKECVWNISCGDTFVSIYRYDVDKEYFVVVSKDYYETLVPFQEEDYE